MSDTGRLRRSDCASPGIGRIRRGRGFSYVDVSGEALQDEPVLARVRALVIPPAWQDVWICADPLGHLQATGIDAAGRKQYLYHERWRQQRDRKKFRRMTEFAERLPCLRRRVAADLAQPDLNRARVLGCTVRLLDIGLFRIGSEEYADDDGGVGLATLDKRHVRMQGARIIFDYPAKSGVRRVLEVSDPDVLSVVASLKRRRGGGPQLLASKTDRRWGPVRSEHINEYIKQELGADYSAKDFRTWNATVLAAVTLAARSEAVESKSARKRAIDDAVAEVARTLGNTPAVARRAYIDPRIFDRYRGGSTVRLSGVGSDDLTAAVDRRRRRVERAVLKLLGPG